jgi:predicted regulator of Ras-like GTPase activity (Roadblock/LC7/MglB family)
MGEIIKTILGKSLKAKTVSEAIQEFIEQNKELSGVAVYSDDGLPVFEEGSDANKIILPANLWLTNYDRLSTEFNGTDFKTTLETSDYMFVFQQMKSGLLLSGIAHKVAPLQYVMIKMDQMAEIIDELL